jgi:tetratricopeptide (TPR) repeat protein
MCRRQTGQLDEALQDIERFLQSDPTASQRADALYEKGLAEVAAGDHPEAIKTFEGLLQQQPQNANADRILYELAWAYSSADDAARAASTFAKLAEQYPDSTLASEAAFHVGEDAYGKKDYEKAVAAYTKAQQRCDNPALAEKLAYKLGWSYFQQQQYDKSLEQFNQQIADFSGGALAGDALFMKGECLFQLKKYDEALPVFLDAGSKEASSPLIAVLTALHGGQSAAQLEKWQQSLELLQAIPDKYPDSPYLPEARYELARAKHKLGKVDEALEDYRWAADRSRSAVGARAQFMAGEILFGKEQYDEAIKDFQRVMFRFGDEDISDDIRNWQAKAGYEAGRCSEVRITSAKNATQRAARIADATKMYTYVVEEHANHELAAEAAKRLEALKKL